MNKTGMMIIISSPSGAGKTTIANTLIASDSNTRLSISVTTRKPRKNEINGKDYHFITYQEYQNLQKNNKLIECAKVFDYYYGTVRRDTEIALSEGIDMVYDIDWQGAEQLKASHPDNVLSIFIMPPSMQVLEERLRNRRTDDDETINKRLKIAGIEISKKNKYDYVLTNHTIPETLAKIKDIISKERDKRSKF